MRIAVVSAHYPPNFISGGTLQPQRLARAMKARGHDVSVFAGWLGTEREPLETWTETDETGLDVSWVVITPWIDWSSRSNFDNPSVTACFEDYAARAQPDIVHFHSLQSLGGGLLPAAARSGARVVVTMHDFWWFCARQFLVDRDFKPCCLVVDAGVCECQVDRAWLRERNSFLSRALEAADLVLAPTVSAARVLAANGIDGSRLRVDENGLPSRPRAVQAKRRPPRGSLRLTYAGGSAEMKGVHVLLSAVRRLDKRRDWSLAAYGASGYEGHERHGLDALPVSLLDPFPPEQTSEVLSNSDVLVVPSVMRETQSLLTREALACGVPVIATDCLGPEEVVTHGENGMIVPADDAEALAAAIEKLLDDPGLLERLRAGCAAVPMRSVDDQADSLLAWYQELRSRPASPPVTRPDRARVPNVVFACGIEGAPLRYRARLPAEALSLLGARTAVLHYRDPGLRSRAFEADAVILYRVPATEQVLDLVQSLHALGIPVAFDVDDMIFDPDLASEIPALQILPPDEAELWMEGVRRYRTTMEACDLFIGSTPALCRHASAVTGIPSERFGNGVGLFAARHSDMALARGRSPGPLRIGYMSGTTTHDNDWLHVEEPLVQVMRRFRDAELWLVGHLVTSPALEGLGDRVRRIPFQRWDLLPYLLRDLDVNLAPLEPGSRFNEAKSAIKWLEAGLVATPTISSPTEAFCEVINHGRNGLLASSREDWVEAVVLLAGDAHTRRRMGEAARRDALLDWSPHRQARRYAAIIDRLISTPVPERGGKRASPWAPVAHDEPPTPSPLDEYSFDSTAASLAAGASGLVAPAEAGDVERAGEASPGQGVLQSPGQMGLPERIARLVQRAASVWRQEGAAAAVRRSASTVRRTASTARPGTPKLVSNAKRQRPDTRR